MAENKKSFVLYCDLIHMVKQLPDEKAGLLFKHILGYVNDEDPISEDLIVNISFEPIKQQLKRDLVKYQEKQEQRRLAGIKSAKSRRLAKGNDNQQALTTVESRSAKSTVNDNVTVNVSNKLLDLNQEKFSFISSEYKECFLEWLDYKKDRKEKYKSEKSILAIYKKLLRLSENNPEKAKLIIQQSIENNYSGLFELKQSFTQNVKIESKKINDEWN